MYFVDDLTIGEFDALNDNHTYLLYFTPNFWSISTFEINMTIKIQWLQ